MAGVFRERKAEESLGERGSGADASAMLRSSRGQLGQPGHDCLRTRQMSGALQQVPDAGGTPQPLTSSREKGKPPTAGRSSCPAARRCSLPPDRRTRIGPTRRLPSSRSDGRTAESAPRRDAPPLCALRAPGLCARGKPDGRAVRSPAAGRSRARRVPVVEGVLQSPVSGAAQYSFSATGSLVYVAGGHSVWPKASWCGSVAMGQSSPWPPPRTPTSSRGFLPTGDG